MKNLFLVSQLIVFLCSLFIPQVQGSQNQSEEALQGQAGNIIEDKSTLTKLLKQRLGSNKFSEPSKTPVDGLYQIQFGQKYGYLGSSGRYVFLGDLIDLLREQNLTSNAKRNIEDSAIPLTADEMDSLSNRKTTDLLKLRLGSNAVSEPTKTAVNGIYQAKYGFNFAYLTENGRYVIMGNLIDLERGLNLTDIAKQGVVKTEMKSFATQDKAIFLARGPEKAVVNIFTDTACAACRKLFLEVPKLQDAGITVQYLPFPDEGVKGAGYATLKQVWCSKDKANALTIGKGAAVGELPSGDCADSSLVDQSFALGKNIGVVGTPAIFTKNGVQIKGYVPYQKLIPRIMSN